MSTLVTDHAAPRAVHISLDEEKLAVELEDGRWISAPLVWFPRLFHATPGERADHRLIGNGEGIHWSALDEDISIGGLLAGHRSGESPESLRKWLEARGRSGDWRKSVEETREPGPREAGVD